ncbi:MAG: RsmE family RNA methyltransferase [Candidatus Caldatribacteriaceae bacterium]
MPILKSKPLFPMSHFFFHPVLREGKVVILSPEEGFHLEVERIIPQSPIMLCDGRGGLFKALYLGKRDQKHLVEVRERIEKVPPPYRVEIWQGILHAPARMDWLVEKATEIGVSEIGFFPSERSVVFQISAHRVERWKKIVINACKQSGRVFFPEIRIFPTWEDFLSVLFCFKGSVFWTDPTEKVALSNFLSDERERAFALLVGPEGGFTEKERETFFTFSHIHRVKLLSGILRSETASLVGASLLMGFLDGRYANSH